MQIIPLSAFVLAALVGVSQASPARQQTVTRTRTVTHTATQAPTATVTRTTTKTVPCTSNNKRDEDEHQLQARKSKKDKKKDLYKHNKNNSLKKGKPILRSTNGEAAGAHVLNSRAKTVYNTKTVTRTVGGGARTVYATSTKTSACTAAAKTTHTTTPKSTPTSAPSSGNGGFNGPGYKGASGVYAPEQVDLHNAKRALHYTSTESTPALTWDDTLAAYALSYGLQCKSTHSGGPYGENLAWETGSKDGSSNAVLFNIWYDEIQYYDYSNPQLNEQDGHFTQVVWKNSTSVGCALVECPGTSDGGLWGSSTSYTSLTCEYNPRGNYLGEQSTEVLPLGK